MVQHGKPVPQAGAIALRRVDGSPQVLLVRARQDPTLWIFPKGHVEAGETAEAAALRELSEEAGVSGRVLGPVGALEFTSGKEFVRVEYFAVEVADSAGQSSGDGRDQRWVSLPDARRLLSFEDAKTLLAKAAALMHQEDGPPGGS